MMVEVVLLCGMLRWRTEYDKQNDDKKAGRRGVGDSWEGGYEKKGKGTSRKGQLMASEEKNGQRFHAVRRVTTER